MNKALLISISSFCVISIAVAKSNKIQDHCKQLPMKAGHITYLSVVSGVQPSNSFIVSSTQNEVYSLTPGTVVTVIHFAGKDYQAVGVQYSVDTVIEYTMLLNASVKPGDQINKGALIGKATPGQKYGNNEAAIEIKVPRSGKKLTGQQVMSFIKRADS